MADLPKPVAYSYDLAIYNEGDLRGRDWRPRLSKHLESCEGMRRNVQPLFTADQLEAYAAAKVAEERERCARICDTTPPYPFRPSIEAAHAIRRGTEATAHQRAPLYTEATMLARVERARAEERERCAHVCKAIAAGHAGAARRLQDLPATHAAGMRDGANECAAAIRGTEAASRGET